MAKRFKLPFQPQEQALATKPEDEFFKEYTELCKKRGFQLAYSLLWVRSQDTGDYRTVIQVNVVPLVSE